MYEGSRWSEEIEGKEEKDIPNAEMRKLGGDKKEREIYGLILQNW